MKQTLQVLLQLRDEGALAQCAVGGAIAAVERMRERDAELKKAREANLLLGAQTQGNAGKGD